MLTLLAVPVVLPVSRPAQVDRRAAASTLPADTAIAASPVVMVPIGPVQETAARPAAPPVRAPMPATPLMTSPPPLPGERARAGRALLLTFDDGPDPRWTPQVLRLLTAYRAKAVFCVVGSKARQHPELIRAIVAGGHELCNHTTHHDEDIALKPGAAVRADLAMTQAILRGITGGVVPRYVRAPGGRWSATLIGEAMVLGLQPLDWSVDPRDWSKPGLRYVVDTVLREAAPGGVVLLHDGGGDRTQSVLALGFLLRRLRQLGYVFR
ncbi:MAG TPA: polysaccharide deacetylase family protein [Mycobacteriales bacterium]|nr:polysaccharide deacetylase family protein [Mycobacteriales bacterium]